MQDDLEETLFLSQMLSCLKPVNLLKQVFTNSITPILVTDAGHLDGGYKIVYANKAFCTSTGYSLAELVGESPKIFQGPNSNRAVLKKLGATLKSKGSFRGTSQNYRKDGTCYPFAWDISSIRDENNKILYFISTQRDLTTFMNRNKDIKSVNEKVRCFIHDLSTGKLSFNETKSQGDDLVKDLKNNAKLYTSTLPNKMEIKDLTSNDAASTSDSESHELTVSATQYLEEERLSESEISTLIENLQYVESEIDALITDARASYHLDNIELKLREISDGIFFLVEFTDVALAITEIADLIHTATTEQLSNILLDLMKSFVVDVQKWFAEIFVSKTATNIYDGSKMIISSACQITSLLNPDAGDESVTLF